MPTLPDWIPSEDEHEPFWFAVDSQPSWDPQRLHHVDCPRRTDEFARCACGALSEWAQDRPGCLALKSDGARCNEPVSPEFPFCRRRHADRAIAAFAAALPRAVASAAHPSRRLGVFFSALVTACDLDNERAAIAELIAPAPLPPLEQPAPRHLGRLPERTALYRHFDADGVLLYVGIANDPSMRFRSHAQTSAWTQFAARHEGEWFGSREEAEAAERVAIREELPLFNKAHAVGDRDARVKAYLISHQAWDLLAVAS